MSAVTISGTFKEDERPDNGLETIAESLITDEFVSHLIVGVVVPNGYTKKPGEAPVPRVKFRAIEVASGDAAIVVRELLDKARAERNNSPLETSLFDADGWAKDQGDDE